jgi:outer membrane protein assembly factor BamA
LGAVLFADYGNTWNSWKDVVWKDFAVSVGWGFRLYTPIAPFRLDFGTKFYNPFNEKTIFEVNFLKNVEIHFGIGEAF